MADINKYKLVKGNSDLYSDFPTNLTPHPDTRELVRITNEAAIIRSIKNLVLTNQYERPFNPDIKSNIRKLLFEIVTPTNADLLRTYIEETIRNFEKRCQLIEVQVVPNEDLNRYIVNIMFYTINNPSPLSFTITLKRVR